MKISALITAALATVISVVLAQSVAPAQDAIVKSNCTFTVFLQSFPYDGSAAGPFTILKPGAMAYMEAYRSTGSTIKLSNKRTLASPLFFGYTNQASMVYYELSSQFGNPFAIYRNKLIPSNPSCQRINCGPNQTTCYSNGSNNVYGCAKPTNLTVTLCLS